MCQRSRPMASFPDAITSAPRPLTDSDGSVPHICPVQTRSALAKAGFSAGASSAGAGTAR